MSPDQWKLLRERVGEIAPAFAKAMDEYDQQLLERAASDKRCVDRAWRRWVANALHKRFGPLDAATEERIAKATGDELDRWALRADRVAHLDNVFDDS